MIYPEPAPVRRAGQGSEDYKREYDAWKSRRDDWQKQQEKEEKMKKAVELEAKSAATSAVLASKPDKAPWLRLAEAMRKRLLLVQKQMLDEAALAKLEAST